MKTFYTAVPDSSCLHQGILWWYCQMGPPKTLTEKWLHKFITIFWWTKSLPILQFHTNLSERWKMNPEGCVRNHYILRIIFNLSTLFNPEENIITHTFLWLTPLSSLSHELRYIHICIFVNNKKGFRECINKTYFPWKGKIPASRQAGISPFRAVKKLNFKQADYNRNENII